MGSTLSHFYFLLIILKTTENMLILRNKYLQIEGLLLSQIFTVIAFLYDYFELSSILKINTYLGMASHAYNPTYSWGWGKRIQSSRQPYLRNILIFTV